MKARHILTALTICAAIMAEASTDALDYIDTRVGTAASETKAAGKFGKKTEEFGQVIPAVLSPHGMNFWTPQTRDTELKCIAPYYYADTLLQGFRNSHWIVGGCTQDYGSMTLMPLFGRLRTRPEDRATAFSHANETARPEYYSVELPSEGIKAEMTGTARSGIFRFTYEKGGTGYLAVNPNSDEGLGFIAVDTLTNTIYGYNPVHRIYQGKGESAGFSGHFIVQLDRPIKEYGCWAGEETMPGCFKISNKPEIGCYVAFDVEPGDTVKAKAASSFTGHEGALANLQAEMSGWDFEGTRKALADAWRKHLGAIEAESDDIEALEKFYGAMYRCSFLPHDVSDADGAYAAFGGGYPIKHLPEGESAYYDGFSLWDTYRAQHPLICLLHPTQAGEMMQSLVHKYEQGGWMPIFPCWNSYTAAMIGDHGAAAIADAYAKGIDNFDTEKAYEGLRKNAFEHPSREEYLDGKGRRALHSYLAFGYIPVEDGVPEAFHKEEQTSRTLEYAFDDFALAQLAKRLGREADYQALTQRAGNYANVINPKTGYADGRHADGTWCNDNPFDFSKHITEGAPSHYTWMAPHDPEGLMKAMGGKKAFAQKLDSMFTEGQYWHGNEPCHQVAYMFNYAGMPWRTAEEVRHIMDTEYLNCPGGLSGNDDAGQMSAWYAFSALGFYPTCPSTTRYEIGSPTFKKAVINLENGKTLTLLAPKASSKNIYVKGIKRDGKPYKETWLDHADLMEGGVWEFDMTDKKTK
ncbi:MAG: GH92 family glycosyl hydrolase [Clostridium sp.]|nr:GH92 family glycosyl hydrolase [Clostridium sp.]